MERIYYKNTAEISPFIKNLEFKDNDYFILENITDIKFENFKFLSFEDWEKGSVFSNQKEFKWRKVGAEFYVSYSGSDISLDNQEKFIKPETTEESSIILWGQQSPKMKDFLPDQYIELPIPKIISYPIHSSFRIKLNLKIYKDENNGIIGFRFTGLSEEVKK